MEAEPKFENESKKVADAFTHGTSEEAAEAISRALLPMNHKDYDKFLLSVAGMTGQTESRNQLALSINDKGHVEARIWASSDLQSDYVVVTPGLTLTGICKEDLGNPNQKQINKCIDQYAKLNKLEDPDFIMAGKTLIQPADLDYIPASKGK